MIHNINVVMMPHMLIYSTGVKGPTHGLVSPVGLIVFHPVEGEIHSIVQSQRMFYAPTPPINLVINPI